MSKAKIAGAPISWGVCEVPGWGPMLPADRVLREIRSLGLAAVELGAPGFLPRTAPELNAKLSEFEMKLVGGFVPVVLHDPSAKAETMEIAHAAASLFHDTDAEVFVSAIVVDQGWRPRYELSTAEWDHMFAMLTELDELTASYGLVQVIHPHVNTLVETKRDVLRVMSNTSTKWCLDTGHLALGGFDPVEFANDFADRVGHVHLKDVDLAIAAHLSSGDKTLMSATIDGMFTNLGQGNVDVGSVIQSILKSGYEAWWVLEQDISIVGEPPAAGSGPVEDVAKSLAFLEAQLDTLSLQAGNSPCR
jgi:inosose dehydratase